MQESSQDVCEITKREGDAEEGGGERESHSDCVVVEVVGKSINARKRLQDFRKMLARLEGGG